MSDSAVPKQLKGLRACLLCRLVKTVEQFKTAGCENCERYVSMKGNIDRIMECTTTSYAGLAAIAKPSTSWVAKWQRQQDLVPGLYALKVFGQLPEDIVDYISRLDIDPTS